MFGRIGALAVALGVGVAVTGSPAMAWAAPVSPGPFLELDCPGGCQGCQGCSGHQPPPVARRSTTVACSTSACADSHPSFGRAWSSGNDVQADGESPSAAAPSVHSVQRRQQGIWILHAADHDPPWRRDHLVIRRSPCLGWDTWRAGAKAGWLRAAAPHNASVGLLSSPGSTKAEGQRATGRRNNTANEHIGHGQDWWRHHCAAYRTAGSRIHLHHQQCTSSTSRGVESRSRAPRASRELAHCK